MKLNVHNQVNNQLIVCAECWVEVNQSLCFPLFSDSSLSILKIQKIKPFTLSGFLFHFHGPSVCLFPGHSYFMVDSKAVLQGCTDRWTLQENQHIPKLFPMTVCMDLRLMTAGKWMAFSYTMPHSLYYDLALQSDSDAMYVWVLGVQHRFPVQLGLEHWHRLCLRLDSLHNSVSLSVSSSQNVHNRTLFVNAMRPNGKLQLGFHPWDVFPGSSMTTMELYLFRVWGDLKEHSACEDGTIVGWDSSMWTISRPQTWVKDNTLSCSEYNT